jgi:hypothetical protein
MTVNTIKISIESLDFQIIKKYEIVYKLELLIADFKSDQNIELMVLTDDFVVTFFSIESLKDDFFWRTKQVSELMNQKRLFQKKLLALEGKEFFKKKNKPKKT